MQDWVELAPPRARSRSVEVVERIDIILKTEEMRECEGRAEQAGFILGDKESRELQLNYV